MRHRVAGKKLGRTTSHKEAMFRNMVTSLILHDRIETTVVKAKELRRWADKMITLAKKNTLHSRRQAMSVLKDRVAYQKLFSNLVDRFKGREGGYTRVLKLGYRHGDNAAMAIIEFLTAEVNKITKSTSTKAQTKKVAPKKESKKETHKAKAVRKVTSKAKKSSTSKQAVSKKLTKSSSTKKSK